MKKIAMKSSPRNETPPSTGSKTPASGKKLVQARLPFKALGGSEPPFSVANEVSETSSLAADNRKRKPNDDAKEDGIRAAKQNRCEYKRGDNITLETSEVLELSNDVPVANETENGAKLAKTNHTSESKENVCVGKNSPDKIDLSDDHDEMDPESAAQEPKAKQSLDFEKKHSEPRKSKRTNESSLITIKLPMTKKSKEAKAKKGKKQKKTNNDDVQKEMEQDEAKDEAAETATTEDEDEAERQEDQPNGERNVDVNASTTMPEQEIVDGGKCSSNDEESELNDSVVTNPSEQCSTPTANKLTPKQMQRRLESEKKKQEKEQARLERERKLQEERGMRQREKDQQKKREREEKDEQRKKEKEMREKKLQEEKLEKQREKEQKEQQRKLEREEKEEQRKREKEERELQKKREREEKDREKEEERKKREDEKRQKVEAEQNKNRKTAEAFVKFFVPKKVESKSESSEQGENLETDRMQQTFMSFQVKEDMKMAPIIRRTLNSNERSSFEQHLLSSGIPKDNLYLSQLKRNMFSPRKNFRTWADDEDEKASNDDLFVIEENGQNVQLFKEEPKKLYRAKFFKFEGNRRPPYYGTWRKKSKTINARKPLAKDSQLDYDVDSDDEWEEEEPGESVESDDEVVKEVESEDEYEIDNEFFVPHGHLSDEELQNEDEPEFQNPADLKIKLKMAQNEFEDERKKKTQKIKPRLIGFIWQNMDGSKPDNCSNGVWELMNQSAMLFNGPTVKIEHPISQSADNSDDEASTTNKPADKRRLPIGEKEIPDLIRLINGNPKNSKFLVKEFCAYLAKNNQPQREYSGASIKAKIQELAIYGACPEEGPMFKKQCWYVPIDTRKRYNLNDLSFPNTWSYTILIPRPVDPIANAENKEPEKPAEPQEFIQLSDDSNSCNFASETLTPELIKQAKSKKTNYNIAKFIRALTHDEKKKQFEPITFNRRASEDQSNDAPSTSQATERKSKKARATKRAASTTPDSTVPKKRINLLMSGPIGQDFSPRMKTTLVTQFLNANVKNQKSTDRTDNQASGISLTNTAGTSDGAKKTSDPVIVID